MIFRPRNFSLGRNVFLVFHERFLSQRQTNSRCFTIELQTAVHMTPLSFRDIYLKLNDELVLLHGSVQYS